MNKNPLLIPDDCKLYDGPKDWRFIPGAWFFDANGILRQVWCNEKHAFGAFAETHAILVTPCHTDSPAQSS